MAAVQCLFVHGWGYDRDFWVPLAACLAARMPGEQHFVDLGFRGRPQTPRLDPAQARIAIGHSLGFPWLLREEIACQALIAINGFSRFTAADHWPGVPPRPLARMRRQFARQPRAVWADFRARCGDVADDGDTDFDLARMAQGLDWLAEWDLRDARLPGSSPVPTLALAGEADQIVPPALSRASFARPGCRLHWRAGGDHLLPRSAPHWCAQRIAGHIAAHLNTSGAERR